MECAARKNLVQQLAITRLVLEGEQRALDRAEVLVGFVEEDDAQLRHVDAHRASAATSAAPTPFESIEPKTRSGTDCRSNLRPCDSSFLFRAMSS